ncbi:MAG: sulfite exporter TauE/SafE family protein [Hyphomicrobiales bacterium]|nr:sulfite exporter TauE/SafE family protein [Hyphomicrobiales bacterium]MBV9112954.1 sulfite exporter TauE/SafE family protein [Hyphomicrobiales bacterium]MBV9520848.1 sulfite exporter TauE/SafE family protein [Hyphomicrobiales bacterium]
MIHDPWFYVAAIPAVTLLGLAKGGFAGIGTLATPIVALVVPPVQAASIVLPILIIQDLYSIYVYRHHWDAFNLKVLAPGAVIGVLIGYLLAARLPEAAVSFAIGTISLVFGLRQLWLRSSKVVPARRPSRAAGWFWGALSGFTSMISHAGSPPYQIYVMPQRLEARIFVGTSVLFFAFVNWMKVIPYLALGQITRGNLTTSVMLFPLAIATTWLGVVLVRRFSSERFYILSYWLMILIGLKLTFDAVRAMT